MPNPFYVDPTAGYDPTALSGLGQAIKVNRQEREQDAAKKAAEQKQVAVQAEMQAAMQSGNVGEVAEVAGRNPEIADALWKGFNAVTDEQKSSMTLFQRQLMTAKKEDVLGMYDKRIKEREDKNLNASHSREGRADWLQHQDLDKEQEDARIMLAVSSPEVYKQYASEQEVKPEKPRAGFQGLVDAYNAAPEGSEEKTLLKAKIDKDSAQSGGISIGADGSVQIGGPVKTVKPIDKQSQEKIISAGESLGRLKRIKSAYDPSFLTYQGKLEKGIANVMNKAGIDLSKEDKDMLRQNRKFTQGVNAEFNAYRKLITGAAAAMSEMEDLKKAMLSTDIGPVEFEAAFNEYSGELGRTVRIRNKLLREGVREGTKQYGEDLDRLFLTGADDEVEARGAELEAQGMSDDDIIKIFESEGYL
tara:strand:- start:63 stop:1313 length:1251 start_codon:yes stop_codon:yes gene_type:complete